MNIEQEILKLLAEKNIKYDLLEHSVSQTCEQSAKLRGLPLSTGAKSLLFKIKTGFKHFTLPAHLQADNNAIRKILRVNKLRFATEEELMTHAFVAKGALPPLAGGLIYDFEFFIDEQLKQSEIIAFNPGTLTKSLVMAAEDYFNLVNPRFVRFTRQN